MAGEVIDKARRRPKKREKKSSTKRADYDNKSASKANKDERIADNFKLSGGKLKRKLDKDNRKTSKVAQPTAPEKIENQDFEKLKPISESFTASADSTNLGAALKAMRVTRGKTQAEVAEAMGIPKSAIGRLEHGKHSPKAETVESYAKAVGYAFKLQFEPLD